MIYAEEAMRTLFNTQLFLERHLPVFWFFFKYSIPARIIIDEMLRLDQLSNIDTRV